MLKTVNQVTNTPITPLFNFIKHTLTLFFFIENILLKLKIEVQHLVLKNAKKQSFLASFILIVLIFSRWVEETNCVQ